jgi:hypothetical protein
MVMKIRGDVRTDDTREDVRADEGVRLKRRRGVNQDKFYVPEALKKPGMSYEWHTQTVLGQHQTEHQVGLAENHWQAVQADEMPGMMPADFHGAVERGGQVLMCRPDYLTEDAQQEIFDESQQRVKTQEQRLGLTGRDELPRTKPVLKRERSPLTKAEMASVRTIQE